MKIRKKKEVRISELPEMKVEPDIEEENKNPNTVINLPNMSIEKEFNERNALRKIDNPVVTELGRMFTRIIEIEADLEVTRYDLADIP